MTDSARLLNKHSFVELGARQRARALLDAGSFRELLDPFQRVMSPWLARQGVVPQADDGVVIAKGTLAGVPLPKKSTLPLLRIGRMRDWRVKPSFLTSCLISSSLRVANMAKPVDTQWAGLRSPTPECTRTTWGAAHLTSAKI